MALSYVHDITSLVGIKDEDDEKQIARASHLVDLIVRTVEPSSWLQLGGLSSIRALKNYITNKWKLVVYTEDAINNRIASLIKDLGS